MNAMTGFISLPRPPVRFILVAALHVAAYFLITDALTFEWGEEKPPTTDAWVMPDKPAVIHKPDPGYKGERINVDPIPEPPRVPDEEASPPVTRAITPIVPTESSRGSAEPEFPLIGVHADPRRPLTRADYPPGSIRDDEEGIVELAVYVLRDGRIAEVRVARSSGYPRLDQAAVEEARKHWRLRPASRGNETLDAWGHFRVVFLLENR
jgi:periplasmic protein TonB